MTKTGDGSSVDFENSMSVVGDYGVGVEDSRARTLTRRRSVMKV